jgi:hypothetical protein
MTGAEELLLLTPVRVAAAGVREKRSHQALRDW